MKWLRTALLLVLSVGVLPGVPYRTVRAQESVFPLPAPLYILTSEHAVLRVDPVGGGQRVVSPVEQPVTDFDIAPGGEWYAYRTSAGDFVVSSLSGTGGYILEWDVPGPAQSSAAQTIAWSPDAARLAYTVAEGVRVAELGAGEQGEAVFSTLQGAFAEMYWADSQTLIVSDAEGHATRVSGTHDHWALESAPELPMRSQPAIPSYLTAQGVMLDNTTAVPATAGALAFDWGSSVPPVVEGIALPADLAYLAPDAGGVRQVWRLPRSGDPAQQVTFSADAVVGYSFSPDRSWIAYVAGTQLIALPLDAIRGDVSGALEVTLQPATLAAHPAWSPDGQQIAYHDERGLWVTARDGSTPPRLLIQNQAFSDTTAPEAVRVYFDPRWSPDGARLLVSVGYWESTALGVLDLASGTLTELRAANASLGLWLPDGRLLTWSWSSGYQQPGLFVLDPAQPDAAQAVLPTGTPVADAAADTAGAWYALIAPGAQIGPQFWRVEQTPQLGTAFAPLYTDPLAGTFASLPHLLPPVPGSGDPAWSAGLRGVVYGSDGQGAGTLVVTDLSTGAEVQVHTSGPASKVQWIR